MGPHPLRAATAPPAPFYDVAIYDGRGRVIWSIKTDSVSLEAPPRLAQRLKPGAEYSWAVTAVSARGKRTVRSPRQRFVISPPARRQSRDSTCGLRP